MSARAVVLGGVLGATTAAAAAALLRTLLANWWARASYGGLESLVSFSSRLIAAARAVESLRPDAFVVDPLAHVLAGPQAMARYKDDPVVAARGGPAAGGAGAGAQQAGVGASAGGEAAGEAPRVRSQPRPVPRLIMRTCFFDDAALAAVGRPPARAATLLAPLLQHAAARGHGACTQVVLLGSGMDTRPWRLDLPAGVAWFEVDRRDVLAAKRAELAQAGATFSGGAAAAGAGSGGGGGASGAGGGAFRLRASSWACAAADLQVPGWARRLVAAGLDRSRPTAWLAEGLLYYLEPSCVGPMLQEAAGVSAPGSVLAANFLTADGLALMHRLTAAARGGQPAGAQGAEAAAPAQQPAAAADAGAGAARASRPSGLTGKFKWGCPGDVEEFFAGHGWDVHMCRGWTQAAAAYGWEPQVTAAAAGRPPHQEVQFAVAVVGERPS